VVRVVLLLAVVAATLLLRHGHPGWALCLVLATGLLSVLRTVLLLRRHRHLSDPR
jgi:hypothetical protein